MYRPSCAGTSTLVLLAAGLLTGTAFAEDPAGVPNFHRVNETVYRGAQPTPEGFQNLAKLGVKTVIDLREAGTLADAEKQVVEKLGMHFVSIPMRGMHEPTADQITKVLALFNNNAAGPVFVHCRRGADRTGTVVACYRISHDHWDNQKALTEARSLGMAWIEKAMQHYVLSYKVPVESATASAPLPLTPAIAVTQ